MIEIKLISSLFLKENAFIELIIEIICKAWVFDDFFFRFESWNKYCA